MGFIQTETPYYQPNPLAPTPFSVVSSLNDPNFATSCSGQSGNCAEAWGLRVVNSKNVLVYGAGHYSFFNNYDTSKPCPASQEMSPNFFKACSNLNGPENCQTNIVSLEGGLSNVNVYCLNTVGTTNMVTQNGVSLAKYSDNINVFPDIIALFQLSSASGGPTTVSSKTITSTSPPPTTLTTKTSGTTSSAPTSSAWAFLGCYTDSISSRTLGQRFDVSGGAGSTTIEGCQAICHANGYSLAGVEYADECCK